jgi:hypothetical protein
MHRLQIIAGQSLVVLLLLNLGAAAGQPRSPESTERSPRMDARDDRRSSDPWRGTLERFDDWAATQQFYSHRQIEQMRRELIAKGERLSPDQADRLRRDLDTKLNILMSDEAREARQWLGKTLAVASPSYAQRVRSRLPDVMNESPPQVQADLNALAAREASAGRVEQGVERTRQQSVEAVEERARRQADANDQARANAGAASGANLPPPGNGPPRLYQRYVSPYQPVIPYPAPLYYGYWW